MMSPASDQSHGWPFLANQWKQRVARLAGDSQTTSWPFGQPWVQPEDGENLTNCIGTKI